MFVCLHYRIGKYHLSLFVTACLFCVGCQRLIHLPIPTVVRCWVEGSLLQLQGLLEVDYPIHLARNHCLLRHSLCKFYNSIHIIMIMIITGIKRPSRPNRSDLGALVDKLCWLLYHYSHYCGQVVHRDQFLELVSDPHCCFLHFALLCICIGHEHHVCVQYHWST